ncbi:MAG: BON domain-containing protein [Desulfovibrio sp.]|jgi:osmotically-inducible protein OsmY|nr:BON domain-containing protein [Desulfovibrio sp.]
MRQSALLLLFLTLTLQGCAATYGVYDDQRLSDTIADDKVLASKIKADIAKEKLSTGWAVAVYSYYGNVYLVGEVPQDMHNKVLTIARRHKPRSVTPHWFSPATADTGDVVLATKLRAELIGTKGLSSTRIDTEVNSGRVVLLGVVKDDAEKRLAIHAAKEVKGIKSVTSYLILPQRGGAVLE